MPFPLTSPRMDSTHARSPGLLRERTQIKYAYTHMLVTRRYTRVAIDDLVNAYDAWAAGIKQGVRASLEGSSIISIIGPSGGDLRTKFDSTVFSWMLESVW